VPCQSGVYTPNPQNKQNPQLSKLLHTEHSRCHVPQTPVISSKQREPTYVISQSSKLTISSAALDEAARKARKAKNKLGNPIKLPSKILAIAADPRDSGAVYVAEAAGTVKKIILEVCKMENLM
jgi:hypothetical protein